MKAFFCIFLLAFVAFTGLGGLGRNAPKASQDSFQQETFTSVARKIQEEQEQYQRADKARWGFSSLYTGMLADDVRKTMGEALRKSEMHSNFGDSEYWYYPGNIQICLFNGRVQAFNKY